MTAFQSALQRSFAIFSAFTLSIAYLIFSLAILVPVESKAQSLSAPPPILPSLSYGPDSLFQIHATHETLTGGTVYNLQPRYSGPNQDFKGAALIVGPITEEVADIVLGLIDDDRIQALFLDSKGGVLLPSLDIGRAVRANDIDTVVRNQGNCYSACALIFISGKERALPHRVLGMSGFSLGFHAPYRLSGVARTVVPKESEVGHEVCAYLDSLIESDEISRHLCNDMFSTQGNMSYSDDALYEAGIATSIASSWWSRKLRDLGVLDGLGREQERYLKCRLTTNLSISRGGWKKGMLETYNEMCTLINLPKDHEVIDAATRDLVPEDWPFELGEEYEGEEAVPWK